MLNEDEECRLSGLLTEAGELAAQCVRHADDDRPPVHQEHNPEVVAAASTTFVVGRLLEERPVRLEALLACRVVVQPAELLCRVDAHLQAGHVDHVVELLTVWLSLEPHLFQSQPPDSQPNALADLLERQPDVCAGEIAAFQRVLAAWLQRRLPAAAAAAAAAVRRAMADSAEQRLTVRDWLAGRDRQRSEPLPPSLLPAVDSLRHLCWRTIALHSVDTSPLRDDLLATAPPPPDRVSSVCAEEFARQLTMLSLLLLRAVPPLDYHWRRWYTHTARSSPSILAFINLTTRILCFVSDQLLLPDTDDERAAVFDFFAAVLRHLRERRDLSSLSAVVAGLTHRAVWRLIASKAASSLEFAAAEAIVTRDRSYIRLRREQTDHACLPYLGMYLTDLTFIHEGNAETIGGLPNLNRASYVASVVGHILRHAQHRHQEFRLCLPVVALLLRSSPFADDDDQRLARSWLLRPRRPS